MAEDDRKLEVLFSGIPPNCDEDDFLAHVESEMHGGGEVKSYEFDAERRTASVTFADDAGLTPSCSCCTILRGEETQMAR
jgi:hypothetical protein